MNIKIHKFRAKIILILLILLFFGLNVFAQGYEDISFNDEDIFPFASGFNDNTVSDSNLSEEEYQKILQEELDADLASQKKKEIVKKPDYSEDLFEVYDDGVYAPGSYDDVDYADNSEKDVYKDEKESYKQSVAVNISARQIAEQKKLKAKRDKLNLEQDKLDNINKEIDQYKEKLNPIYDKIDDLKSYITVLNSQLTESSKKISNIEYLIGQKQLLLQDLMKKKKESSIKLASQKKVVLDYVLLMYRQDSNFNDVYTGNSSNIKLLLSENTISENLLGSDYLEALENTGRKVFYDLHNQNLDIEAQEDKIRNENNKLNLLYDSLNNERQILKYSKKSKKDLLSITMGKESEYQKLIEKSVQEQLQSTITIQSMKSSIGSISDKLNNLDVLIDEANDLDASNFVDLEDKKEDENSNYALSWPVKPLGITAYFHDVNYPKKWGVHNAIDIRAKQYTEIHAPANSYVFQTQDNGMGYSYVILAHKNKLITVYGHVSKILVKQGNVVKQGDVIALSGGTPGTRGAGWQTTGPHLHFEVWDNGKQVNPLDYLPVNELPDEYIPDRFKN